MNLRRIAAQLRFELRLVASNGESLLLIVGLPLGLLCFFSIVEVLPTPDGTDAPNFLVPGIVTLAVMSTAFVNTAISTGFDRHYGVLKRLGATPLRRTELVTAKVATVAIVQIIQVGALLVVGAALGWDGPLSVAELIGGSVVATVAFVGMGMLLAGRLPGLLCLAVANALYIVLLLISGLVFPLDELPAALATMSRALPSTALASILRGALGDPTVGAGPWVVLACWALAAPTAAVGLMRWQPS